MTAVAVQEITDRVARRALARAYILRERGQEDARWWIERWVHIEDRDAEGLAVAFRLWPAQVEVLDAFVTRQRVIVLKARQLGLTWLALAYAAWRMVHRAGYQVVAMSKREEDSKELVRRMAFILRHLPRWMIRHRRDETAGYTGPVWDDTTLTLTIQHPGGEPAVFRALTASRDSGRSLTANLLILDEWAFHPWAEEIWAATLPTVHRPTGGQVIGLSTMRTGTLFHRLWDEAVAGENGFHPVFLPWHADPRRTREWYEQTKRDMPTSYRAEYPATPEEAISVGEGAAFPEWDSTIHQPFSALWYPPRGWRIIRAYDAGWRRACCKWYAVAPDGWAVCYREYYPSMVSDEEQARTILEMSRAPDGSPENVAYTVADPAAWGRQSSTGVSTAETFARMGIPMRPADNDRKNGWRRLHQWLQVQQDKDGEPMAWLRFTAACRHTPRAYTSIPYDEHDPEDVADHPDDHLLDVDRYFVMSRPAPEPRPKERERRLRRRAALLRPVVSDITGY